MYGGLGYTIGSDFNPALPLNKRLQPNCYRRVFRVFLAGKVGI